ncbi:MAG: hypothetical protein QOE70_5196 [Chthoniobacter sp.]|jgi:cytohesin|nr:hypothetical protein [Chthoniobacter sp.]
MTRPCALFVLCTLLAVQAHGGEIHEAAAGGDLERIKALCTPDFRACNEADADGLRPLHHAVAHRRASAAAALLAAGARIDERDREGQTPLHHLAHSVEESVVENFKNAGSGSFAAALRKVTESGQTVTLAVLLELLRQDLSGLNDPLPLLSNFAAASTPEQMAAEVQTVTVLLAAGAEVNALDRERSTPLHHAAMSPRPDLARALLDAGAKIDARNQTGLTPLHNAALFGGRETLEFLLDRGADPEGRALLTGVPPLLMAVTRGDPAIVRVLLDHRADVNALGPEGETALCRAAILGSGDLVRLLIERGANVNARFSPTNRTPAHVAAARGFVPLLNLLLAHGADPEAKDRAGFTPLHDAAEHGRTLAVRALLNAGAPPDAVNLAGRTALWQAASQDQSETVAYLLQHGADAGLAPADGQSPLHIAAFNDRPATVRVLLEKSPPLGGLARLGTPLHCASFGPGLHAIFAAQAPGQKFAPVGTAADSTACAKLLIAAGAPLEKPDANGVLAVHIAAQFGNLEVLQCLIGKQKWALTARDAKGLTVLHHAARGPLVPGASAEAARILPTSVASACGTTVQWLLAQGTAIQARDSAGLTPLHHAAGSGNLAALSALLAAKADVSLADKAGATPLHWAAARGQPEAAAALLAARARVNATDAEGQTPLHMAVAAGQTEVVLMLLAKGANPNLGNRTGQNALSYAESYRRPEISKLLRQHGATAAATR